MSSKNKKRFRKDIIKNWGKFQKKLEKYLAQGNDPDFMAALRSMLASPYPLEKADLKKLIANHHLNPHGTVFERLYEMQKQFNKIKDGLDAIKPEASEKLSTLTEEELQTKDGNKVAEQLIEFNHAYDKMNALINVAKQDKDNIGVFRLKAKNLDIIVDSTESQEALRLKKAIQDQQIKFDVLEKLKKDKPLSKGIISFCQENPNLNAAQAREVLKIYEKYTQGSHPDRHKIRKKFLGKVNGRTVYANKSQFNRAWEEGQNYLQKAINVLYSGSHLQEKMRETAKELEKSKGEGKNYESFKEAVEAMRKLDSNHLKALLGKNAHSFRNKMEKKLKKIDKYRKRKSRENMFNNKYSTEEVKKIIINDFEKSEEDNLKKAIIENCKEVREGWFKKAILIKAELLGSSDKNWAEEVNEKFSKLDQLSIAAKEEKNIDNLKAIKQSVQQIVSELKELNEAINKKNHQKAEAYVAPTTVSRTTTTVSMLTVDSKAVQEKAMQRSLKNKTTPNPSRMLDKQTEEYKYNEDYFLSLFKEIENDKSSASKPAEPASTNKEGEQPTFMDSFEGDIAILRNDYNFGDTHAENAYKCLELDHCNLLSDEMIKQKHQELLGKFPSAKPTLDAAYRLIHNKENREKYDAYLQEAAPTFTRR